jgi:hypothetical protein
LALFEDARIRARIRAGLGQVPAYAWDTVRREQIGEVVDLVCRATKGFWNWGPIKKESVSRKAIFSLQYYGNEIKKCNGESGRNTPFLPFMLASEAIAIATDDLLFHGLIGEMLLKDQL